MGKHSLIPLIYGYLVCIICVIVFFIAGNGVIDAAFTYARPQSGYQCSQYNSYPEYKTSVAPAPGTELSEADYQKRHDDCLSDARFQQLRNLFTNGFLLILALGLFFLHWRWVNVMRKEQA